MRKASEALAATAKFLRNQDREAVQGAAERAGTTFADAVKESADAVRERADGEGYAAPVTRIGKHASGYKPPYDHAERKRNRRKMSKATRRRNRP